MRPNAATAAHLAETLNALLSGKRLERIWRPEPQMLLIDVGSVLEGDPRARLLLDVEPRSPRVLLTSRWPDTPSAPDRETLIFRGLLENDRIESVSLLDDRTLAIATRHQGRSLTVQLAGRFPNIAVKEQDGTVSARLFADRPPTDPESPPLQAGALFAEAISHNASEWLGAWGTATWTEWDDRRFAERQGELLKLVKAQLARQRRTLKKLEQQLEGAEKAEQLRQWGELLKTVVREIAPGATEATAIDWYSDDQRQVTLPLDPALSALDNMARYFHRYRKLLKTRDECETRVIPLWDEIAQLDALVASIDASTTDEVLETHAATVKALGLKARATQGPPTTKKRGAPAERLPYRVFAAQDGAEIWLGRSAKDNDAMTFRHARGQDLFFHARDVAGSHVILRAAGKKSQPHPEAVIDAALLAAWHSKAKNEGQVTVLFTERKHVRKGKGLAPGRVTVSAMRTVLVRVEADRIKAIYDRSGESE